MTGIWAVARQTFAQCLRTKVGGVFIILLAIALLVTPMLNSDSHVPLADRIRVFLTYSTGIATVLLVLVTVFLAAGVISDDVSGKQIFLVAVKPLARWRYVLGRWLGVVMLDAALLCGSGVVIYAIAQYMRVQPAINANDRRAVETEVFTARKKISPDMGSAYTEMKRDVDAKIAQLKTQGGYDAAMDMFRAKAQGDEHKAMELLRDEYQKQFAQKFQSAAPGSSLAWIFKDIKVAGDRIDGDGVVLDIARDRGLMLVQAPRELLGKMLDGRPVRINEVEGRVGGIGRDYFGVQFDPVDLTRGSLAAVGKQGKVRITLDPVLQITFKASAIKDAGGEPLHSRWEVRTAPPLDPAKPYEIDFMEVIPRRTDASGLPATLTVSSRAVNSEGRLLVIYTNLPQPKLVTTTTITESDISVLYHVGSFEANFARGLAMIMVQLMFVAALGVFAGSFLGFAVAAMLVFVALPFGLANNWLVTCADAMPPDFTGYASSIVVTIISFLVPNLEKLWPSGSLVGGLAIPWDFRGLWPVWSAMAGMAIFLAAACLIFHKRELARIQV